MEGTVEKRLKILVIEANSLVQKSIKEMMGGLELFGIFADDGISGLKLYSPDYSFILMDQEMPRLSGVEVTQIIRAFEKNAHLKQVPIVGITSLKNNPEVKEKCLSAGQNLVLGKPTIEELEALIEEFK